MPGAEWTPDERERLEVVEQKLAETRRWMVELGVPQMSLRARQALPALLERWLRHAEDALTSQRRSDRFWLRVGALAALVMSGEAILVKLLESWKW